MSLAYGAATQSPAPISQALLAVDQLLARDPIAANAALAAVETMLAGAVLCGLWARWALLAAVPLFVGIWAVGQGLGLPFTPGTTDLNSGPVYVLLALALWRARSWERWSLDALIRPGRVARTVTGAGAGLAVLLLAALATGSALGQARTGSVPSPRAGAALASTAQGPVILFGGCGPLVCDRGTWSWSPAGWRELHPRRAPPAVGYAGIAPVPGGGLLLFGGSGALGAGPTQGTSWRFQRGEWRRVPDPAAGPSARRFPAMAGDPAQGAVVLIGGDDGHGHVIAGTWLFARGAWQRAGGRQPPARTAAAIAYDPALGGVVLFGGNDGSRARDDTWLFARGAWLRLHPRRRPPARAYVQMATDPQSQTVVLLAGPGGGAGQAATWTLSGRRAGAVTWVAHPGPAPPAATFAALATAPAGRGVVCFGGATPTGYTFGATAGGYAGRLWLWHDGRWRPVRASNPAINPRQGDV